MNKNESKIEKTIETTPMLEIEVEELEAIVAPGLSRNHNETLLREE
jgi:hypothetical protein